MQRITESTSLYRHLEKKSTFELLADINTEDQKVALAVQKSIHQIAPLIDVISEKAEDWECWMLLNVHPPSEFPKIG